MSSIINTNSLSLLTQNNLTKSQSSLTTAIQRLSSGLRINSAKDDAAGQAIANRFTANIKGLSQAQRNANDGISLAQTTEGALNEINTNLQRIRELTVQSANGSNSAEDKISIQSEITQRLDEIDRTSTQTDFNGTKVLSSTAKALSIQVGANDNEVISIDLEEISKKSLGLNNFTVETATGAGTAASSDYAAQSADYSLTGTAASSNYAAASSDYDATALTGTAASTDYAVTGTAASSDYDATALTGTAASSDYTYTGTEGGTDYALVTGTAASSDYTYTGTAASSDYAVTGTAASSDYTFTGTEQVGTAKSSDYALTGTAQVGTAASSDYVAATTVKPLAALDAALKKVDTLRGSLGAVQNRFDSVISNLGSTITNLAASRSRIEDADYATEVSNMTRAQILQQAGTSVLSKANQSTQGVMSLLQ